MGQHKIPEGPKILKNNYEGRTLKKFESSCLNQKQNEIIHIHFILTQWRSQKFVLGGAVGHF